MFLRGVVWHFERRNTFTTQTNYAASAYATACSAAQLMGCLTVINKPFPAGVTTVGPSIMTKTALLNQTAPALIGYQMSNLTPYMESSVMPWLRALQAAAIPKSPNWRRCEVARPRAGAPPAM